MKIRIQGQPEFLLPLTPEQVAIMIKVSEKHYDGVCREASQEKKGYDPLGGNYLITWRNVLDSHAKYPSDDPDFVPCVTATWRQIDTTLKTLEPCNLYVLDVPERIIAGQLSYDLRGALRRASDLYPTWCDELDTQKDSE